MLSNDGGESGSADADGSTARPRLRVPVVRLTGACLLGGVIFGAVMAFLSRSGNPGLYGIVLGIFFAAAMWVVFYLMQRSRLPAQDRLAAASVPTGVRLGLLIGVFGVLELVTILIAVTTGGSQPGWRRWIAATVVAVLGVVCVALVQRRLARDESGS